MTRKMVKIMDNCVIAQKASETSVKIKWKGSWTAATAQEASCLEVLALSIAYLVKLWALSNGLATISIICKAFW